MTPTESPDPRKAPQSESEDEHRLPLDGYSADALRQLRQTFSGSVNTTAALAVVAIGWLISSDTARNTLGSNSGLKALMIVAVVLFAALHQFVLWGMTRQSERISQTVVDRREIVEVYRVSGGWSIGASLISGGLFALICILVATI